MLCAPLDLQYAELPSSASDAVLCSVCNEIEKKKKILRILLNKLFLQMFIYMIDLLSAYIFFWSNVIESSIFVFEFCCFYFYTHLLYTLDQIWLRFGLAYVKALITKSTCRIQEIYFCEMCETEEFNLLWQVILNINLVIR